MIWLKNRNELYARRYTRLHSLKTIFFQPEAKPFKHRQLFFKFATDLLKICEIREICGSNFRI